MQKVTCEDILYIVNITALVKFAVGLSYPEIPESWEEI